MEQSVGVGEEGCGGHWPGGRCKACDSEALMMERMDITLRNSHALSLSPHWPLPTSIHIYHHGGWIQGMLEQSFPFDLRKSTTLHGKFLLTYIQFVNLSYFIIEIHLLCLL